MGQDIVIPPGVPTRWVEIGPGAIDRLPQVLARIGVASPARGLVVQDARTGPAAGDHVTAVLAAAGYRVRACQISDDTHGQVPGDYLQADQIVDACDGDTRLILGVGSGVVNDLGKLAAWQKRLVYVAVATAASMNGYGSPIAAVVQDGVKRTLPAAPTAAIVADLNVLAKAPIQMTRSGFADLLSKSSATADWKLASLVRGEPFDPRPAELLDPIVLQCQRSAQAIGKAEPEALGLLIRGLIAGGFAMTLAGHSSPASGGEHLLSHLWDMTAHAHGTTHYLHGFQVAIGTRVVSSLYRRLLAMPAAAIDVDRLASRWRPWSEKRKELEADHGPLFHAVEGEAHKQFLSQEELRRELAHVRGHWDRMRAELAPMVMSPERLLALHWVAGVPTEPSAVGQSRASVRHALLHAKDVRARFTVLHLADELGVLEPWADAVLDDARIA